MPIFEYVLKDCSTTNLKPWFLVRIKLAVQSVRAGSWTRSSQFSQFRLRAVRRMRCRVTRAAPVEVRMVPVPVQ